MRHILTFAKDDQAPQVYLALAHWYERYTRDFERASQAYVDGGPDLVRHH
jgi:hypothetical protein